MSVKFLLKDTFFLGCAGVICGIIGIISMILMSKIYSPTDYGIFTIFVGVAAIFSPISNLSLEYGVFQMDKKNIGYHFNLTLITSIIVSFSVYLSIKCLLHFKVLPDQYQTALGIPIILLLYIFCGGVSRQLHSLAFKQNNVKYSAISKILESLTHHAFFLCLGLVGFSYYGMQISSVLGFVTGIIFLFILKNNSGLISYIKIPSLLEFKTFIKDNKALVLGKAPYILIHNLNINAQMLLAAYFLPLAEFGVFALAMRLAKIPYSIFSNLHQSLLRIFNDIASYRELLRVYSKLVFILVLGSVLSSFILHYIPQWLFTLVFAESWVSSFDFLKIILLWIILEFVAFILGAIYQRIGFVKIQPYMEFIATPLLLMMFMLYHASETIELLKTLALVFSTYYIVLITAPIMIISLKLKEEK